MSHPNSYTIEPTVVDGRFMWKLTRWRVRGASLLRPEVIGDFPSVLDAEMAITHLKSPVKEIRDE